MGQGFPPASDIPPDSLTAYMIITYIPLNHIHIASYQRDSLFVRQFDVIFEAFGHIHEFALRLNSLDISPLPVFTLYSSQSEPANQSMNVLKSEGLISFCIARLPMMNTIGTLNFLKNLCFSTNASGR